MATDGREAKPLPEEAGAVPLSLRERQAVVREFAGRYAKAPKAERSEILDQAVQLLGYNRHYAARALRTAGLPPRKRVKAVRRRGRRPTYDGAVQAALRRVWIVMSFAAGKRMAPSMAAMVTALEEHGELQMSPQVRDKLLRMSAATIDRLLAPERQRMAIKGRTGTKPGSLLKGAIPIKTFTDWDDSRPGFLEIDLVAHDGGDPRGEYAQTLDILDVATGWTETAAVPNKAQRWVHEALLRKLEELPFPTLGIDSDNGAEFINKELMRFCEQQHITFTRSRPYRKNDNCHVEQKNWSVIRRMVGYLRYDSPLQVSLLNQLYDELRLYSNFFQPTQKLVQKTRHGARVHKTYDTARTPYQRVLACSQITQDTKQALTERYRALNPAALRREITKLQQQLLALAVKTAPPREQASE